MHIANTRIKNIANIDTEIGQLDYAVPLAVLCELESLSNDTKKGAMARLTLQYIQNYQVLPIIGSFADDAIVKHIRDNGGIVATMDIELKQKIKTLGGSIISVANDRILLER